MKKIFGTSFLLGLLGVVGLAGCVPYPFTSAAMPAVHGTVRDGRTGKPIEGVEMVSERYGHSRRAMTKADGSYALPALSQWHYFVYLGSPGVFPTPWRFEDGFTVVLVTARKAGYGTVQKKIPSETLQTGKSTLFSESYVPVALDFTLRRGASATTQEATVSSEAGKFPAMKYPGPVPGKPGFVVSPWAPQAGYVDVRGFPSGTEVKCPYTGKVFRVP